MPRFEYRFDIAAILLASVLTAIGISAAQAGGRPTGGGGGDVLSRSGADAATSATTGGSGVAGGSGFTQSGALSGGVVGSRR